MKYTFHWSLISHNNMYICHIWITFVLPLCCTILLLVYLLFVDFWICWTKNCHSFFCLSELLIMLNESTELFGCCCFRDVHKSVIIIPWFFRINSLRYEYCNSFLLEVITTCIVCLNSTTIKKDYYWQVLHLGFNSVGEFILR